MIKKGTFTSIWDDCVEVETPCKINTKTGEVFDIEKKDVLGIENLTDEFVTFITHGKLRKYEVSPEPMKTMSQAFWYRW